MNELFGSQRWSQVLCQAYDFDLRWSTPKDTGAIPYCVLDDLAGRRVSALPFSDYLPLDTTEGCDRLLAELRDKFPASAIVLKTRLPEEKVSDQFRISRRAVYHRLPSEVDEQSSSFKRAVRRAIRAGTRVEASTDEAGLNRFLDLYHWQRIRKFKGIPQPPSFFRAIHDLFVVPGYGFYLEAFTASHQHAATLVVLQTQKAWFYKFGASHPDFLDDRPNNLLFAELADRMKSEGIHFLDLGLSGSSEAYAGLRRFKAATGAREFPLHYLTYEPPGYDGRGGHDFRRFLGSLTAELVAQDAGPALVAPLSERIYPYFA